MASLCCWTWLLFILAFGFTVHAQQRIYKYGRPPMVLVEKGDTREYVELKNDIITGDRLPPANDGVTHLLSTTQIFVGISSLRDDRCGRTLHSLITAAEHPQRVFFGVVQQNDDETIDCVKGYCALAQNKSIGDAPDGWETDSSQLLESVRATKCPYYSNIQTIRMKHSEAKGPNLARGKQITMIDGEDFCLQVDAHTFGGNNWDTRILAEWGAANNEMAVLTTYIGSPDNLDKNVGNSHEVPHLCTAHLQGDFPFNDRASAARYAEQPILCGLWAAGLSFSKCHAELRVPADINLIQIWTGEEFGRGARLWTNGYDFYTPTQPLIAHDYTPGKNQKKWNHDRSEFAASKARLETILKMDGSDQSDAAYVSIEKKYDIGDKRTLQQYANFSGIDIMHRKELFSWCTDYKWIPYEWDDPEIEAIRRFGNPKHYLLQQQKAELEKGRGFIEERIYANEEMIYNEIVGEIEHFQHSSTTGKLVHIVVFLIFFALFLWCLWTMLKRMSIKQTHSD